MSITLSTINGRLAILDEHGQSTGEGIMGISGGILDVALVTQDDLTDSLQTKIEQIDTIQTLVTNLSTAVDVLNEGGNGGSDITTIGVEDVAPLITALTTTADVSHFAKEWMTCGTSGNMVDIECSGNGKVVLVCPWSATNQFSINGGITWSINPSITSHVFSCSMNADGKYICIANNIDQCYISNDYGTTFSIRSPPSSLSRSSMSSTGQYIACACSNKLSTSRDFGDTWTNTETTLSWSDTAMAIDGTIIYACSTNGYIKKSIDFGATWTTVFYQVGSNIKTIACSGNGKYILASLTTSSQLIYSPDYGATFSYIGTAASYYKVIMSKDGMCMAASVNPGLVYYSSDGGESWANVSSIHFCSIAMSYSGNVIYSVAPYNNILKSTVSTMILNTTAPTVPTNGSIYLNVSQPQNPVLSVFYNNNYLTFGQNIV